MKEILKTKGCKITTARLAILKIFSKSKNPLNAESVYKKLKRTQKNINEVTVYRTLSSFTDNGILKRIDLRKNSTYFELVSEHHHHIICMNCDAVEDFKNLEIEKALERIVGKLSQFTHKFKSIQEHSLELFGLCRVCA